MNGNARRENFQSLEDPEVLPRRPESDAQREPNRYSLAFPAKYVTNKRG